MQTSPTPPPGARTTRLLPALALLAAGPLEAQTHDWINASGGTYSTAANWSPAGPPGAGATVRLAIPNTYNITFSGNATADILTMSQGNVTLFLNGFTCQFNNTVSNGMGAAGLASSLRVSNGTFLAGNFSVGGNTGSNSTLTLDAGSTTTVGPGVFQVGTSGTGTLIVKGGGDLATTASTALGVTAAGAGAATVTGADSTWTAGAALRVGASGSGTLHVLNGGAVTAAALEIGENAGAVGALDVSGANSACTVSGTANVGGATALFPAASGTLAVGPGATVNLNGPTNLRTSALLQLTGGTLNLNTLTISAGARVAWAGGTVQFAAGTAVTTPVLDLLLDGGQVLGANRTLVAASGTTTLGRALVVSGELAAADLAVNAPLEIGPFGTVSADTMTLGPGQSLQVADFGTLATTSYLFNDGGTLELQGLAATVNGFAANNFGTVQGTGVFAGGLNNGTGGTIRGRGGDHLVLVGIGLTNPGRIELSGGTVEYTHVLSNLATGIISGRGELRGGTSNPGGNGLGNLGQLQFSGGFTDIHGGVINSGGGKITVSGGGLLSLYDALAHNGADVKAAAGSALVCFGPVTGAGPFSGSGTVSMEGGYSPGSSPAQVTIATRLALGPANLLTMEIGGTTAGSDHDQLDFGSLGELAAGGSLEVKLVNGFTPQLGDAFQLLLNPKTTGTFAHLILPPLPQGLAWNAAMLESQGLLAAAEDLTDTDGDGLPDWWEQGWFGGLGVGAGDDGDHDGSDALGEWLAGTDPTDPASRLRARLVARTPGRATVAVAPHLGHRVYRLEFSDDLLTPWQMAPGAALEPAGGELLLHDTAATTARRLYRVGVQLAP